MEQKLNLISIIFYISLILTNSKNFLRRNTETTTIHVLNYLTVCSEYYDFTNNIKSKTNDQVALLLNKVQFENQCDYTNQNETFIIKKYGNSTNLKKTFFYGMNSALLFVNQSNAYLNNKTIYLSGYGAIGIYIREKNTYVTSKIPLQFKMNKNYEFQIPFFVNIGRLDLRSKTDTVYTTECKNCPAMVATTSPSVIGVGNTISLGKNITISTKGKLSPCLYIFDWGRVSIRGKLYSYVSPVIVSKGYRTFILAENTVFYYGGEGNPKYEGLDYCGIFMYEIEKTTITRKYVENDLDIRQSEVYSTNGTYSKCAPFITVVNTNKTIDFSNVTFNIQSEVFLRVTSSKFFGIPGENGGNVSIYIHGYNKIINGDFVVDDKYSGLYLKIFGSNLTFNTAINKDNLSKNVTLRIRSAITLNLTATSYFNVEYDNDNAKKKTIIIGEYKEPTGEGTSSSYEFCKITPTEKDKNSIAYNEIEDSNDNEVIYVKDSNSMIDEDDDDDCYFEGNCNNSNNNKTNNKNESNNKIVIIIIIVVVVVVFIVGVGVIVYFIFIKATITIKGNKVKMPEENNNNNDNNNNDNNNDNEVQNEQNNENQNNNNIRNRNDTDILTLRTNTYLNSAH